jgi:hypothetical protein
MKVKRNTFPCAGKLLIIAVPLIYFLHGSFIWSEYLWGVVPVLLAMFFYRKEIYIKEEKLVLQTDKFMFTNTIEYKLKDISDLEDGYFGLSMFAGENSMFFDYCIHNKSDLLQLKAYIEQYQGN